MAIASQGFYSTVTLIDNGGNTSTVQWDLTAATIGEAVTETGAMVTLLQAVTDAVVMSYRVGEKFAEETLSLPAGGVQVENTAVISAKIAGEVNKFARLMIPAPKATIFVGSSGKTANVIDPSDADLVAYLQSFETGGEATVSDGEVIDTVSAATVSGKRVHRASRSG